MGRYSTGAQKTNRSIRLEMSNLLKSKIISKGKTTRGSMGWNCGSNMGYLCSFNDHAAWIELSYIHTHRTTGEETDYKYKIYCERKPSNLGKGEVLYFICPISGLSCRKLYIAYGYPKFKARQAYKNRIYYPDQLSSKLDRPNDRYWRLKRELDAKDLKHHKEIYNGNVTKSEIRLMKKRGKMHYYDSIRWNIEYLPKSLRDTFHLHDGDFEKMVLY